MKHVLVFCLLLLGSTPALADPDTIDPARVKLGYADIEVFPTQMGDTAEIPAAPGIAVELVQAGFAQAGIGLDLVRLPNRRVIESVKTGEIDGAFLFSYSEERNAFAAYPEKNGAPDPDRRLDRQTYVLYKRADSPLSFDGGTIQNLHTAIAANSGFSIATDLLKRGFPVMEVETTQIAIRMLLAGRVDAYALMDSTGDPYLRNAGIDTVAKLPTPIASKDYFLIFSRRFMAGHAALAEQIWTRLAATREAMEPELLRKYLGPS